MSWLLLAVATITLLAWLHLLFLRGEFWRANRLLGRQLPLKADEAPEVVAVVPARNEAETVGSVVRALLAQDYAGRLRIVLVDDGSDDGTAALAREAAEAAGQAERLTVLQGAALPPGWAGKLWALNQGVAEARRLTPGARYLWFIDADIVAAPDSLSRLTAKAEGEGRALVSLMALLHHKGAWPRLLIPPFVFFFQKLYPFSWSNDPERATAAAAGGCVLLRADSLQRAGGLEAIRDALIDDCALARLIKTQAREEGRGIWLGLTRSVVSVRPYRRLSEIWGMVARSAYTQLDHSPLLLLGTVAGMLLLYAAPPLILLTLPLHGAWPAAIPALAAWLVMAFAAWPTYRLYRESAWRTLLLPLAGLLYTAMTLDSAWQHTQGRGGFWKGRAQAPAGRPLAGEGDGG